MAHGFLTPSMLAKLIEPTFKFSDRKMGVNYGPNKVRLNAPVPLHEHCLFKNGIHLGQIWYQSALARWLREHKRNRFLFTAPPLRLPGAAGSPAVAVATV